MRYILPLLATLLLAVQDPTAETLVGQLPDSKAKEALIKMGRAVLPLLTRMDGNGRITWKSPEQHAALHEVVVELRGWKDAPRTPELKSEHQVSLTKSLVLRTAAEADTYFEGWRESMPWLDLEKEMILYILPDAKLQAINVTEVIRSDEKKTVTVSYDLVSQPGCGNTLRCETATAITVPTTKFDVVFKGTVPGPLK